MKTLRNAVLLVLALGIGVFNSQAQNNYKLGELLVQLKPGSSIKGLVQSHQNFEGAMTDLKIGRKVAPSMDIYLLKFDHFKVDQDKFMRHLSASKDVRVAQRNHIISLRSVEPNDPEFSKQWQYINDGSGGGTAGADLDAELAWEHTTGGTTYNGDTIVACIIDDGLNFNHSDFEDNIWINRNEIAGNGVDDDGNGYIDDINGWDADGNSGSLSGGGSHGTPVTGIIGAKGNNGNGVAGVNWNVKLMIVKGGGDESQAIAAYNYPLAMRKLYNQTNGAKGAFVVVTNASWGVDGGKAADAPLWCAIYDSLGKYGVLNAGATANNNVNVDSQGDLPTQCPSDHLVTVTNIDRTDNKVTYAGYGTTTIDLGAFGADTWTTASSGGYAGFGGTSGATPHVAGTIALLYSAECPSFAALAESDPEEASRLAKKYILDGVDANSSLSGITVTEGRLNMNNSLELLLEECTFNGCFKPGNVRVSDITLTSAKVMWKEVDSMSFEVRYRTTTGDTSWTSTTVSTNTYSISDLTECASMEVQVRTLCDTSNSEYSSSVFFKTDGCCEAPNSIQSSDVTDSTAVITWNEVTKADAYVYQWKVKSASATTKVVTIDTSISLSDLSTCTEYTISVASVCSGDTTAFNDAYTFSTGCGTCISADYCESTGGSAEDEWISKVELGDINHESTGGSNGYEDHTSQTTELKLGGTYSIKLTPDFSWEGYEEYFRVWIDYNQDGDFEDADELVFDPEEKVTSAVSGSIVIPSDALLGATRMRVSMKYQEQGLDAPDACESMEYGEVEDYCVTITDTNTGTDGVEEALTNQVKVFPNPFNEFVQLYMIDNAGHTIQVYNAFGQLIYDEEVSSHIKSLSLDLSKEAKGVYYIHVMNDGYHHIEKVVKL